MQSTIENFIASTPTGASTLGVNTAGIAWNNLVLSAVFGVLVVGTGGVANARMINCIPSGPIAIRVRQAADVTTDSCRLLDTQEKLAGIGRYLSMNVTNMARALCVRRPTVYSWLRDAPNVRPGHAQRLETIYKIAREWRIMSSRPIGGFLNRQLASGTTILDLLSARTLDEAAISTGFSQILEALNRTPRPLSVVEVAKRRGVKLSADRAQNWASNDEIDM